MPPERRNTRALWRGVWVEHKATVPEISAMHLYSMAARTGKPFACPGSSGRTNLPLPWSGRSASWAWQGASADCRTTVSLEQMCLTGRSLWTEMARATLLTQSSVATECDRRLCLVLGMSSLSSTLCGCGAFVDIGEECTLTGILKQGTRVGDG